MTRITDDHEVRSEGRLTRARRDESTTVGPMHADSA